MANLDTYFDINDRERVNVAFRSTTADKTMLFSGPQKFEMLAKGGGSLTDENLSNAGGKTHVIAPLVFTTAFQIMDNRNPGRENAVIGSDDTFVEPSPGGTISIQVSSYSIVAGDPLLPGGSPSKDAKFNLIKRMYYDVIQYDGGALIKNYFLTDVAKDNGFTPVAADLNDLFVNFGKSEFFNIEFGILRVTLTKGNDAVLATYYENCRAVRGGGESAQAGGQNSFQTSLQISAARAIPLAWSTVEGLLGDDDTVGFFDAYMAYVNGES